MAAYDYIDNTGVIVPDTSTLRDEVVSEWQAALGTGIVTTPDTPQGVLITAEALAREGVVNNNAQLANQINPNLSGGVFLDAICALLGLERRPATPSVINGVLLTGVPGTNIPAGSQAKSIAGDVWLLTSATVLNGVGVATASFQCAVTGAVSCAAGQLNQALDMVLGWEGVTNLNAATLGSDEESDTELRERRRATLARQGISTREAQLSGLFDIDGVSSAVFRENVASTSQTIDGVLMVAHSVWACVDGGTDDAVAASLLNNKTDGAAWNGAVSVPIIDPYSGQEYEVLFDRPTIIRVGVRITILQGRDQTNPILTVPQAIASWAAGEMPDDTGLTIGAEVSVFEVAGAVNYYHPGFTVRSVELVIAGVVQPGNVAITLKQRAQILAEDVVVTVDAA